MKKIKYFILPIFIVFLILIGFYIYDYLTKEINYLNNESQKLTSEIKKYKKRLILVKNYIELKKKIPFKIKIFKNNLDAKVFLLVNLLDDIKKYKGNLIEYKFINKPQQGNLDNKSIELINNKKFSFKTINIILKTKFKNYKDLVNFIKFLETNKYLFLINKIDIKKEGLKVEAIIRAEYEFQLG